jgi:hypothetical protein
MDQELYTLADASRILSVRPHVLAYALLSRRIPEPRRAGGRRVFTMGDLVNISEILKLEIVPELIRKGEIGGRR